MTRHRSPNTLFADDERVKLRKRVVKRLLDYRVGQKRILWEMFPESFAPYAQTRAIVSSLVRVGAITTEKVGESNQEGLYICVVKRSELLRLVA